MDFSGCVLVSIASPTNCISTSKKRWGVALPNLPQKLDNLWTKGILISGHVAHSFLQPLSSPTSSTFDLVASFVSAINLHWDCPKIKKWLQTGVPTGYCMHCSYNPQHTQSKTRRKGAVETPWHTSRRLGKMRKNWVVGAGCCLGAWVATTHGLLQPTIHARVRKRTWVSHTSNNAGI